MDQRRKNIGLACAGGGIEGCIYEIGALCALDEAIEGVELHRLGVYVGVSAGALVVACLANGLSARTMSRAIISQAPDPHLNLRPEILFSPAFGEYAKRLAKLPAVLAAAVWTYLRNPLDRSPVGALYGLGSVMPVGFFDNKPLEQYLARGFSGEGRTNDFRANAYLARGRCQPRHGRGRHLRRRGHRPCADLQGGAGQHGLAGPLRAGRDRRRELHRRGARRTVHASVALDEGAALLFCINPLVPVNTEAAHRHSIVRRGLPAVLSQSFCTLVHSRMRIGFRRYKHVYPDADILLIEPTAEDYELLFSNLLSFSNRHAVCEHAYQSTRRRLRQQADALEEVLQRHGLRHDVLDDDGTLYGDRTPFAQHATEVLDRLEELLDGIHPTIY